jgi:hypothetical protein
MPLTRGLILITCFALVWGVLAGMNAAVLRVALGASWGTLCFTISVCLALLETLVLVGLVDRRMSRRGLTMAKSDPAGEESVANNQIRIYELSGKELAILASLMDSMIRGGQNIFLTEDFADPTKRDLDTDALANAMELAPGVRPRNLNTVVIRKFMGSVIHSWIQLKVSVGLIPAEDEDLAIHQAAAQFATAFPFPGNGDREKRERLS